VSLRQELQSLTFRIDRDQRDVAESNGLMSWATTCPLRKMARWGSVKYFDSAASGKSGNSPQKIRRRSERPSLSAHQRHSHELPQHGRLRRHQAYQNPALGPRPGRPAEVEVWGARWSRSNSRITTQAPAVLTTSHSSDLGPSQGCDTGQFFLAPSACSRNAASSIFGISASYSAHRSDLTLPPPSRD